MRVNSNVTFYDLTEDDKQDAIVAAIEDMRDAVVREISQAFILTPRVMQ